MPSSPNETQCPLLGQFGVSPKSYEEYQEREKERITNINTSWFDQMQDEQEIRSDEDDDIDVEGLYSDSKEEDDSEDEFIFQFDKNSKTSQQKKKSRNAKCVQLPFWYESEDSEHLHKIVEEYEREIRATEGDQLRSDLTDRRRLPTFVGRIKRIPVFDNDSFDDFTTLDKVEIYRRDIRPCGSSTTRMMSRYMVTSWDDDGMPENFVLLSGKKLVKEWKNKRIKKFSVSYIYCLPVWESRTAFSYSVEKDKHDVGYASQPFNYTPYLPKEFLGPLDECEGL